LDDVAVNIWQALPMVLLGRGCDAEYPAGAWRVAWTISGVPTTRGLHSSTFQLNLSRF